MEGHATISPDILARYAADAARGVAGVRIAADDGRVNVELHLGAQWGASIPALGLAVQERVAAYLAKMAPVEPDSIDVVVHEIGPE